MEGRESEGSCRHSPKKWVTRQSDAQDITRRVLLGPPPTKFQAKGKDQPCPQTGHRHSPASATATPSAQAAETPSSPAGSSRTGPPGTAGRPSTALYATTHESPSSRQGRAPPSSTTPKRSTDLMPGEPLERVTPPGSRATRGFSENAARVWASRLCKPFAEHRIPSGDAGLRGDVRCCSEGSLLLT